MFRFGSSVLICSRCKAVWHFVFWMCCLCIHTVSSSCLHSVTTPLVYKESPNSTDTLEIMYFQISDFFIVNIGNTLQNVVTWILCLQPKILILLCHPVSPCSQLSPAYSWSEGMQTNNLFNPSKPHIIIFFCPHFSCWQSPQGMHSILLLSVFTNLKRLGREIKIVSTLLSAWAIGGCLQWQTVNSRIDVRA